MTDSEARRELIEATVHGSYWLRRAADGIGAPTLVGFHGYGQTAESNLRELNLIPGVSAWNVLAVQALHPFYNSRTQEVVASWMTRLDRELAIENNIRYVSRVLDRALGPPGRSSQAEPLVYVGFSQGTAMAYRTAARAGRRCSAVVALGGDVPPELADPALADLPLALIGIGSRDEWYTEAKLSSDLEILRNQGVDCRPVRYQGGHEWTDEFRSLVGRFLAGLRGDV